MFTLLITLSMAAASPDPTMNALLSCLFKQADSSQSQGLSSDAFGSALKAACQTEQGAAEQAAAKRFQERGSAPGKAQEEAAEAVRQARAAMARIYSARLTKK